MNSAHRPRWSPLVPGLFLFAACAGPNPTENKTPPPIFTLSLPVDWLTRQLAAPGTPIELFPPPGEDPPDWKPSGDELARLADAQLIIANGAGYEAWLSTAVLPERALLDTSQGLSLITLPNTTHAHGASGEHSHQGIDPHIWSDPTLYLEQAQAIATRLESRDPADAPAIAARLTRLREALTELDTAIKQTTAGLKGQPFASSHPAFHYFARRYELSITAFGFEPDAAPSAMELEKLQSWQQANPTGHILLWEEQPTDPVKTALPAHLQHIFLDPLEQPRAGTTYDYPAQAAQNLETFRQIAAQP
jgi:zinc transport system substrate-binding protein